MPRPAKKVLYASLADQVCGTLGRDYYIKKSKYGKGVFARHEFETGEILMPYDGDLLKDEEIGTRKRTHLLRVKESDYVIDGLPLSKDLRLDMQSQEYWPQTVDNFFVGFGALCNSANQLHSNAVMKWLYNDRGRRPESYNPQDQTFFKNQSLFPKQPYLVAKRPIDAHEEILWTYQVEV